MQSSRGPINRNFKSFANAGFFPSILCPINCKTQDRTNINRYVENSVFVEYRLL